MFFNFFDSTSILPCVTASPSHITSGVGNPVSEGFATGKLVKSLQGCGLSQEAFNQETRATMKVPLQEDWAKQHSRHSCQYKYALAYFSESSGPLSSPKRINSDPKRGESQSLPHGMVRTLKEELRKQPPSPLPHKNAAHRLLTLLSALSIPRQPWQDVAKADFHLKGQEGKDLGLRLANSGQQRYDLQGVPGGR